MSEGEPSDDAPIPAPGDASGATDGKANMPELRRRAEQMLPLRVQDSNAVSEADNTHLIHELQVHQIELEMQNEELLSAQVELQAATERYSSLYDFAPVGYLTLDEDGVIVEANNTLSRQLGLERTKLLSSALSRFVDREDQGEYYLFRHRLLQTNDTERCEVRLRTSGGARFWAHLEASHWPGKESERLWRITVADVTERRTATEFLEQQTAELERRVEERTQRLDDTNRQLLREVDQRREAELLLRDREGLLEQRVEERTRSIQSLLDISHNVVSTLRLPQVVSLILDHLQHSVGYSGCAVYLLDGQTIQVLDYRGPLEWEEAVGIRLPLAGTVGIREVMSRKQPLLIEDLASDSAIAVEWRTQATPAQLKLLGTARSWLGIPLIVKDRAIGALRLAHERAGYFSEQHAQVALTIANQTAVAIENARLHQHAQQLTAMEERQRLARELHDSVAQTFYSIALSAHALRAAGGAEDAKSDRIIDRILALCEAGLAETRGVVSAMRPEALVKDGLVGGLKRHITALRVREDITIEASLCDEPDAPMEVKEALFRIAQEALRNVMRHAGARGAIIRLTNQDNQLELVIADDGQGFDPSAEFPGLGLRSMQERAAALNGALEVISRPGSGTRIVARLPVQQET